jgi:hypothetical protein
MESLSPNLFVKDIRATLDFYKLLGFSLTMSVPGENEDDLVWAMVTNGKVTFMFQSFKSIGDTLPQIRRQEGGPLLFYIKVQRIREFFETIRDKTTLVHGLLWGNRILHSRHQRLHAHIRRRRVKTIALGHDRPQATLPFALRRMRDLPCLTLSFFSGIPEPPLLSDQPAHTT